MREEDIRPKNIFDKYLELCSEDIKCFFANSEKKNIPCPGCLSWKISESFSKDEFTYCICANCNTWYVNPLPLDKYFINYYKRGKSVEFWCSDFYPSVEEKRRKSIYCHRAKKIKDFSEKCGFNTNAAIMDVGAGFGTFLEEIKYVGFNNITAVEPSPLLAETCRQRGFRVIEEFLEKIAPNKFKKFDVITCFELLEHLTSPNRFLQHLYKMTKPGSLLLMTTLSCEGFDFRILRDKHKNVTPPYHIVFFNTHSVKLFLERNGFDILKIETPGTLDVDIVCNSVQTLPELKREPFINMILNSTEKQKNSFQNFLAKNLMSSHMWIWFTGKNKKKNIDWRFKF